MLTRVGFRLFSHSRCVPVRFIRGLRNEEKHFGKEREEDDFPALEINGNSYVPHGDTLSRSLEDVRRFREENRISVKGDDSNPILEFRETGFPMGILERFEKSGFQKPTPIQAQSWPIALSGKDIIAIGETGSGKTLGFVLPGVCHLMRQLSDSSSDGPIVLVLAPTRELAQQIHQVTSRFAYRIRTACLVGGTHKSVQLRDLDRGANFIVATPGRLIDLLEEGSTHLNRCSYIVLDEADRMLDMGFEPQIRNIINRAPMSRQMLMWSATWPKEVERLAQDFFGNSDYAHVNIGSTELQANKSISQSFAFCEPRQKDRILRDFLESLTEFERQKILLFTATKNRVDNLSFRLKHWGYAANGIHGDKTQSMRTRALGDFKSGRTPVLVATDVASRGLDVDDIRVVINYDFPNDVEDYVHRIGRTGRNKKAGKSFSFFNTEMDASKAADLIKVLKEADQLVPEDLHSIASSLKVGRKTFSKYQVNNVKRKKSFDFRYGQRAPRSNRYSDNDFY